jgi:hypothetical protein
VLEGAADASPCLLSDGMRRSGSCLHFAMAATCGFAERFLDIYIVIADMGARQRSRQVVFNQVLFHTMHHLASNTKPRPYYLPLPHLWTVFRTCSFTFTLAQDTQLRFHYHIHS